jgi:hypothetical protein
MGDFFSSSKDKPTTQTTNTAPWAEAQPYLKNLMAGAQNTAFSHRNPKPYPGAVQAPMNAWQKRGLQTTANLARQPNPGLKAAQGLTTRLMQNNGMTPELNNVASLFGQFANSADGLTGGQRDVAGLFGQFANSENGLTNGQNRAAGYLDNFANGSYTEDPRMLAALKAREGRAMNGAATMFGNGRYGSAGIGQGVGRALSEAGDELMLQSNESARNRQLQSSGMLGDLYTTGAGQKLQATQGMGDIYGQGAQQKLNATQGMGNLYEGGRSAALASAGMLPMLKGVEFYNADKLTGAGQTYTDRAQTERDAQIKRFEELQSGNLQWDQIAKLTAALSGMGKVGGTESKVATPAKRGGFEKTMDIGGQLAGLLGAFF